MKKILLLGGSAQQVIAIEKAKALGYYTVLCDYLPDNPGQYHADKYYSVSTTDKDEVLKVAESERVDGVLAYASDPAAPSAAYVAERLGLPGNPYRSVEILCNKDLFRTFLAEHGFCTPKARGYASVEEARDGLREFSFPVIVKPVDSSGSKGVGRIDEPEGAYEKLKYAMSFSRAKRIVVEDWVEQYGYQIVGDGLSIDGELAFRCFGNGHFNPKCVNPFVPVSDSFPCNLPEETQNKIHAVIQRLLKLLEIKTCSCNFDMRLGANGDVYLMEVAPRNGGNYIPDVIRYATGVDLAERSILAAMGEKVTLPENITPRGFWSYYVVHSLKDGVLQEVCVSGEARRHIVEEHMIAKPGDSVKALTGANTALGCYVMQFDSMNQMLRMMDCSEEWIEVKLEN